MEKDWDELEDILPESSSQLVSLNTRVPRSVSRMIDECVGILQTTSPYLKFTKQSAVQVMLERGYQLIREEFERLDRDSGEVVESQKIISEIAASVEPETLSHRTFDMKAYAEMANKTVYAPRSYQPSNANSERAEHLQKKLGLR